MATHPGFELRLGLGAWAGFIVATSAYCLVHQAFVSVITPDLGRTLTIALREWGAWALLAPVTLRIFRGPLEWRRFAYAGLSLALLAAALPILIDQITGDRALGASLALYWPRNVAMTLALLIIARVSVKPTEVIAPLAADSTPAPVAGKPATLLVTKGADQSLIRIDDIQYLSAAGNYVDIRARGQDYLLRSTMGEAQALLPAEDFVRIHRSHIVRVCEIERIRVERSGSGIVQLRSGGELPISKACRAQLRGMYSSRSASTRPKSLD